MVRNNQIVIVGAGLSGLTLAERFANVAKMKVLVVEKRDHIGGNCFDFVDKHGILVSKYGPHIFHTQEKKVYEYIKNFADWEKYEHQVFSMVGEKLVPIPVNIETINLLFNESLKSGKEMKKWLDNKRLKGIKNPKNGEEEILSKVGKEIYELMFKSFTKKQWGRWPKELEKEILARVPIRYSFKRAYNSDKYQLRPKGGLTRMMEKMSDNPNIEIRLKTDFFQIVNKIPKNTTIFFTGPVDEYISYKTRKKFKLPYRSVKFVFESSHRNFLQKVGVINYPSLERKMLRSTEYKYLTGQKSEWTTVSKEYFCERGEPMYPIISLKSMSKREEKDRVIKEWKNIYFVGRLGKFEYINMDRAILESLDLFEKLFDDKEK